MLYSMYTQTFMPPPFAASGGPLAPTLDLVAASDTGISSTDNITNATTPNIDILFGTVPFTGDVINIKDGSTMIVSHTITSGEAGSGSISLGLSALSQGSHSLTAQHVSGVHSSAFSSPLVIVVDTTAPTITSGATGNNTENTTLVFNPTANETVTWSVTGGADAALFEFSGSTLRWLANTTHNFEAPNDADTNNAYVVQITATDTAGNTTNQTVTITVINANDAPTVANPISNQSATVGVSFSFQFASNTFADEDSGDTFTYTATLSSGGALPGWLTFTAGTRTFSGTPSGGDVGTIAIKVVDTDSGGLSVSNTFNLTVSVAASRNLVMGASSVLPGYLDSTNLNSRQYVVGDVYVIEA